MKYTDNSKWKPRFLELSLRAIKKVHNNYLIWNIGIPGLGDDDDFKKLNSGRGIELASEPSVCDAITQEIMSSNILLGHNQNNESNNYRIEREFAYEYNSDKRTDIMIQKLCGTNNKDYGQVFIEAKRINFFTTKFSKIKYERNNYESIRQDIAKLTKEWECRTKKLNGTDITDNYRACLLLWGIYEKKASNFLGPKDAIKSLNNFTSKKFKSALNKGFLQPYHEPRWYPLTWKNSNKNNSPKPTRWVWINLIELDYKKRTST